MPTHAPQAGKVAPPVRIANTQDPEERAADRIAGGHPNAAAGSHVAMPGNRQSSSTPNISASQ
jgi:hypothetical protein